MAVHVCTISLCVCFWIRYLVNLQQSKALRGIVHLTYLRIMRHFWKRWDESVNRAAPLAICGVLRALGPTKLRLPRGAALRVNFQSVQPTRTSGVNLIPVGIEARNARRKAAFGGAAGQALLRVLGTPEQAGGTGSAGSADSADSADSTGSTDAYTEPEQQSRPGKPKSSNNPSLVGTPRTTAPLSPRRLSFANGFAGLSVLTLSNCSLTDTNVIDLVIGLRDSSRSTSSAAPQLRSLDLSHNDIGNKGAHLLAGALQVRFVFGVHCTRVACRCECPCQCSQ